MRELTTSQVLAEAGSGQSDPITPDPFHFLIFALPTQVLANSCTRFGHSLQRQKTAPHSANQIGLP